MAETALELLSGETLDQYPHFLIGKTRKTVFRIAGPGAVDVRLYELSSLGYFEGPFFIWSHCSLEVCVHDLQHADVVPLDNLPKTLAIDVECIGSWVDSCPSKRHHELTMVFFFQSFDGLKGIGIFG